MYGALTVRKQFHSPIYEKKEGLTLVQIILAVDKDGIVVHAWDANPVQDVIVVGNHESVVRREAQYKRCRLEIVTQAPLIPLDHVSQAENSDDDLGDHVSNDEDQIAQAITDEVTSRAQNGGSIRVIKPQNMYNYMHLSMSSDDKAQSVKAEQANEQREPQDQTPMRHVTTQV